MPIVETSQSFPIVLILSVALGVTSALLRKSAKSRPGSRMLGALFFFGERSKLPSASESTPARASNPRRWVGLCGFERHVACQHAITLRRIKGTPGFCHHFVSMRQTTFSCEDCFWCQVSLLKFIEALSCSSKIEKAKKNQTVTFVPTASGTF